jgi:hypothetical protein
MPHFWDTWTTFSSSSEIVNMSEDLASKIGAEAASAITTLPHPSLDLFGTHIKRDKVNTKYMSGWLSSTGILFP